MVRVHRLVAERRRRRIEGGGQSLDVRPRRENVIDRRIDDVLPLVGTLVWVFLGEHLVAALLGVLDLDGAVSYLPFRALDSADGTNEADMLSYWPGVAVSLAWIALIGTAGVVRTRRRDIS